MTIFSSNCHLNEYNKGVKVYLPSSRSSVDPWLCARGVADVFPIATSGSLAACYANRADPLMALELFRKSWPEYVEAMGFFVHPLGYYLSVSHIYSEEFTVHVCVYLK